jgi:molybdate transport system permease protein
VSLWSVAASLPPGLAIAWLLARCRFPGRLALDGLVHLPLVLPPVVIGYGLLVLLGRRGPLGAWLHDAFGITIAFTWKGAVLASAVMAFPLMVRAIRLSLEGVDQRLEAAARTLGSGRLRVFLTITLPLMAPGILTGVILAFARSVGEFGATITFVSNIPGETQTLPLALYSLTQTPSGDAAALRLAILSVILAMAALLASEVAARRLARRLGNAP